jgi:hypothetical protein
MFQKFCGYTTIQGLVYIFVQNLTPIGKTFWSSAFFILISLGSFWATKMYSDWQNGQVKQLRFNTKFLIFSFFVIFIILSAKMFALGDCCCGHGISCC